MISVRSFFYKILLFAFGLLMLGTAIFYFWLFDTERKISSKSAESRANAIVDAQVPGIISDLTGRAKSSALSLRAQILKANYRKYSLLFYAVDPLGRSYIDDSPDTSLLNEVLQTRESTKILKDEVLVYVIRKIKYGNQNLGYIVVGLSRDDTLAKKHLKDGLIVITVASLILSLSLFYVDKKLKKYLYTPMGELNQYLKGILAHVYEDKKLVAMENSGFCEIEEIKGGLLSVTDRLRQTADEKSRMQKIVLKAEIHEQIARQIAHDIRSPLSALDMIIKSTPEIAKEKADLLKSAIDRIQNIANDLLKKGRPDGTPKMQPEPLMPLIAAAVREHEAKHANDNNGPRIPVTVESTLPDDFKYCCNKHDLARVLSNLINNAHDAVAQYDPAGRVAHPQIKIASHLSNHQLVISIIDNGAGMPPEVLKRIGEKGLTHGKGDRGNGLGVHHAFEVIGRHGGDLTFQSQVGRGTTATITLPL